MALDGSSREEVERPGTLGLEDPAPLLDDVFARGSGRRRARGELPFSLRRAG